MRWRAIAPELLVIAALSVVASFVGSLPGISLNDDGGGSAVESDAPRADAQRRMEAWLNRKKCLDDDAPFGLTPSCPGRPTVEKLTGNAFSADSPTAQALLDAEPASVVCVAANGSVELRMGEPIELAEVLVLVSIVDEAKRRVALPELIDIAWDGGHYAFNPQGAERPPGGGRRVDVTVGHALTSRVAVGSAEPLCLSTLKPLGRVSRRQAIQGGGSPIFGIGATPP